MATLKNPRLRVVNSSIWPLNDVNFMIKYTINLRVHAYNIMPGGVKILSRGILPRDTGGGGVDNLSNDI